MAKKPKQRRYVMRRLQIKEISGVDRPAQEPATALIMKRDEDEDNATDAVAKLGSKAALTTSEDDHTHLVPLEDFEGNEVRSGVTTWAHGHDHPFVLMEDGSVTIGWIDGHTHEIDVIGKVGELPTEGKSGVLSNKSADNDDSAGDPGQLETNMTQKDTKAEVQELQVELAKANKLAGMNDAHKAHFSTLEGDAAESFLNKSAEDRKAELDQLKKAAADTDPVVYTTSKGVGIRKSAGEAVIEAVKSADEVLKQNLELKKEREQVSLEKRAEESLKHFPGELSVRAAILKAVDGIEDAAVREAAHASLRSHDAGLSEAFVVAGHEGTAKADTTAIEELDQLAKAHSEKNQMSYTEAYNVILTTQKGQELYAKSVS